MVTTNQTRSKPQHRSSSSPSPFQQVPGETKSVNNRNSQRRTQSLIPQSPLHEDDNPQRRPSSPVMSTTPRLSIADRFMSSSGYQHSPLTSSPLSYTSPILTDNEDTRSTQCNPARLSHLTRQPSSNSLSTTNDTNPNPSRLTIASTFMKSSSSVKQSGSNINGTIHPLDNTAESTTGSLDLNLDLPPTSPSSLYEPRHASRFGSQDTLVTNDLDNKKQQYPRQRVHGSIDEEDEEQYHTYQNDQYQRRQQDHPHDDERHESASDLSSVTRHGDEETDLELQNNKFHGKHSQHQNDGDELMDEPRGFWIGCCFISCGQRQSSKNASSKQTQQQKQRQQQQEQQNQQEQQQKQHQQPRTCGRRWRVFALFLSTLFLIILSSIFWPRTPLIRIEGASLLSPARVTETSQGAMLGNVQFESQWMVNFTVDNRQNWLLPTRLVQLHVLVKDALTGNVVGKGFQNDHPEPVVLDPRAISTVQLGVYLDYQARDVSDTTFASLKKGCIGSASTKRSVLMPRGDGNGTIMNHGNNTTTATTGTNHTMTPIGNNNNNNNNNMTTPASPPPPAAAPSPPPAKEHESLSLLFWVTLHIWGLDFFGYRPTVMVVPASGGFVCPLS